MRTQRCLVGGLVGVTLGACPWRSNDAVEISDHDTSSGRARIRPVRLLLRASARLLRLRLLRRPRLLWRSRVLRPRLLWALGRGLLWRRRPLGWWRSPLALIDIGIDGVARARGGGRS